MDKPPSRWDRELRPRTQVLALLVLWAWWGGTAVYVFLREWRLNENWRYYDNPALVYSLLLFWLPLPQLVLGLIFLRRPRADETPGHRAVRVLVGVLTLLGGVGNRRVRDAAGGNPGVSRAESDVVDHPG